MLKALALENASFPGLAVIAFTGVALLTACTPSVETTESSGTSTGTGSGGASTSSSSTTSSSTSSNSSTGGGNGGGSGCVDDSGCLDPAAPYCDLGTSLCVACLTDTHCPPGQVCDEGKVCTPGCSPAHACPIGLSCCEGACTDLALDLQHCGACDLPCPPLPNALTTCESGLCTFAGCTPPFVDCNGLPLDGCELNPLAGDICTCLPGATEPCYTGAPGTLDVGACSAGFRVCAADGASWGMCQAQTLPISEVCANGVDDDCNGQVDDIEDPDHDGFTRCDGDCDEIGIVTPGLEILAEHINPGAFEVLNNGVDDDCDPSTSDSVPSPTCSPGALFDSVSALDLARAMDLCQMTVPDLPLAQRKWGLLDASFLLADGSVPDAASLASMQSLQTAVLSGFGVNSPHHGATMAGLSTGRMRDAQGPGFVPNVPGSDLGGSSSPPATYLAAHGGFLPANQGCNGACPSGAGAFDSVRLRLSLRVPTNARSFSYEFRFFSAEYGARSCSPYNDAFLALLDSQAPGLPLGGNIAFDALTNAVLVNDVFFESCVAQGCAICPLGAADLDGTGLELGAGTAWLVNDAPVVFGETIQLDLMIFDVTDGHGDSHVVIDNFRWQKPPPLPPGH